MGAVLVNDDLVLDVLHELGYIDKAMPMWYDFNHDDARKIISLNDFQDLLTEKDGKDYFLPRTESSAIPLTLIPVDIPYDESNSLKDVGLVGTIRPLTFREVFATSREEYFSKLKKFKKRQESMGDTSHFNFTGGEYNLMNYLLQDPEFRARNPDFNVVPKQKESVHKSSYAMDDLEELTNHIHNHSHFDVFYPHIPGFAAWTYDKTLIFYPFRDKGTQAIAMDVVKDALLEKDIDNFIVRDSGISIQNRLKYSLKSLKKNDLVFFNGSLSYLDDVSKYEDLRIRDVNALASFKMSGVQLRKIAFSDIASYLSEDNDLPFVSYIPISLTNNQKKGFNIHKSLSTLPVFLSNHNPFSDKKGVFNYGLLLSYASNKTIRSDDDGRDLSFPDVTIPSATISFWKNPEFAGYVSELISEKIGLDIKTVYAHNTCVTNSSLVFEK